MCMETVYPVLRYYLMFYFCSSNCTSPEFFHLCNKLHLHWRRLGSIAIGTQTRSYLWIYKIFYERNAPSHRVSRSIESGEQIADAISVGSDIVGLEKFTNYCVWGVAFNRMGIGNETQVLCISTDEDGMK